MPSSLSTLDNKIFPSSSPPIYPSPSLSLGRELLPCSSTSVNACPLSPLSPLCLYQPLSPLPDSLHRGESTHLPSRCENPLPSISFSSLLEGDWYLQPPPFLSPLSPASTFSPPVTSFLLMPVLLLSYLADLPAL